MNLFEGIADYLLVMKKTFTRPVKFKTLANQVVHEMYYLGVESLPIVCFLSLFIGIVVIIQTAFQIESPLIPKYTAGFITRVVIIYEFSPTIMSMLLAGRVGSRIAAEIGTMKVTEQIDALEVMGINSASYLILPKIIAFVIIMPVIITFSIFSGLFGGYLVTIGSTQIPPSEYFYGLRAFFTPFEITYALSKSLFFGFIITSISGFYGYIVEGGALEVGKNSTKAMVQSSIFIIIFDVILTQIFLG
ncbi:MAG: ABC transporter permease [Bacteroidales bacterium]|jgi:phospholipid/cholesterol/gamma-HCH transport system permease protein|nr:ABC transporter permease [Bacteroidales bacterium]MDI9575672.1 ABC transporter permease [Bacteroidota bacterium]MDD3755158.1 ABC transporter permease [Bacteroidales bacterium]MDY0400256.1 ABC transporter permease [Bacteroidales bacterium]HHW59083.1 ABC transporter permease [Bacteroidales bacterium]